LHHINDLVYMNKAPRQIVKTSSLFLFRHSRIKDLQQDMVKIFAKGKKMTFCQNKIGLHFLHTT